MIRRLIASIKGKRDEPIVYSRVVSDANREQMIEMLKVAVRRANEDQRAVALSRS